MKKTYSFLKTRIFVLLGELIAIAIMGAVMFTYLYDEYDHALRFPNVITILFALLIAGTIATAIVICLQAEEIGITRIKKTNKFILFADALGLIMMLAFFIYECITCMAYMSGSLDAFTIFRVIRWVISSPACGYFLIQALPNKINRVKIEIPYALKIGASVSIILWSILGIFTTYFAPQMSPNDISKISMMFVYAVMALYFIFEGEFNYVKTQHKPYMIFAFICSAVTFAFPFGISIAKIFSFPFNQALSQPELLVCSAIGVYSLAKMFALISTMRIVIENSHGRSRSSSQKKSEQAPQKSEQASQKNEQSASQDTSK